MEEFEIARPIAHHDRARCCCSSCSGSTPRSSGPPSTTRRRATASGRGSGAGWPGTASGSRSSIAILFIHPAPQRDLYLGSGDRLAGGARRDRLRPARHPRGRQLRDLSLPPDPLPRRLVVPGCAAQLDRHRVHRRGDVPRRAPRPAPRWPASTRRSRTSPRRSSTRSRRVSAPRAAIATCSC